MSRLRSPRYKKRLSASMSEPYSIHHSPPPFLPPVTQKRPQFYEDLIISDEYVKCKDRGYSMKLRKD